VLVALGRHVTWYRWRLGVPPVAPQIAGGASGGQDHQAPDEHAC
jgi:hypothetical protein